MNPFIQAFPITVIEKNQTYSVARSTDIVDGIITKSQKVTDTVQLTNKQSALCIIFLT